MSTILDVKNFSAWYGKSPALEKIDLDLQKNEILGIIGPAGGGKTTFLRSLNRMNDLLPTFRMEGEMKLHGINLYDKDIDVANVRRKLGMVFAVPNPVPGTIYQNLQMGPKLARRRKKTDELVEKTLRAAYLWDEVKDRLDSSSFALSGGQQQRLCLARTLMMEPEILLLDEPCSGLDPISTAKIEEALVKLKSDLTVVLVTNNVMQSSRIADRTAFFLEGKLIEFGETRQIFVTPKEQQTSNYIRGNFG